MISLMVSLSEKFAAGLTRVTSTGRAYFPFLDGMRFFAISWVFIYHVCGYVLTRSGHVDAWREVSSNPIIYICQIGDMGVDLFFVISGFLLALPFAKHYLGGDAPVSLRTYYVRRLTRLEPPYLLQLFGLLVLWLLLGRHLPSVARHLDNSALAHSGIIAEAFQHVGASAVYAHQLVFGEAPIPNGVLWSLEIEVQFYVLVPILAWLSFSTQSRRVRRTMIVAAILGFSYLSYVAHGRVEIVHQTLLGHLQKFLIGFLLVDLALNEWREEGQRNYWDLLSLLGWLALFTVRPIGAARHLLLPWAMLLVYLGAFRGARFRRVLSLPLLTTIGGMCYTIYMYHNMIISSFVRLTARLLVGPLWLYVALQCLILAFVVLAICTPLFVLCERPFMASGWHLRAAERVRRALERRYLFASR